MDIKTLRAKFRGLARVLTERSRRVWAATEAAAVGHGGIAMVERATGISRSTISRGLKELREGKPLPADRTRRPGGGRNRAEDKDPSLVADLDAVVEPTAAGAPDSPLRWTARSVRKLDAREYIKTCGHYDAVIGDLFPSNSPNICDFVEKKDFVQNLARISNYVIVNAGNKPDLTQYKIFKYIGRNFPYRQGVIIYYFATRDIPDLFPL